MKKYFAFFITTVLMVGALANQYGDLSPEDIAEIENQNGGSTSGDGIETILPIIEEEVDPIPDPGTGEPVAEDPIIDDPIVEDPIAENPGEEPPEEELDPVSCNGSNDSIVASSNECLKMISDAHKLVTLSDGSVITNFSGNLKAKSGHIVTIENTRGNLFLIGIGNAYVESISNTAGNLTICNMDVGIVDSVTAGNISIDGGNVCKINGHKGNVKINNGSVKEVNHNKGNIQVTNGNIGNINAHTGNIRVKNGTITGTVTNSIGNIKVD